MHEFGWKWPVILTISAAAVEALALVDVGMPIRPIIMMWFLIICPGMAFVHLLQIQDPLSEIVLAVALSLVLDLLIAAAVLYAGLWSPDLILNILKVLTLSGVLLQLFRWYGVRAKRSVGQI